MKTCRICYELDEDISEFIEPCNCRGTSRYVHEHCLKSWQTASLQRNPRFAYICQICQSNYCIRGRWLTPQFLIAVVIEMYQLLFDTLRAFISDTIAWHLDLAVFFAKYCVFSILHIVCSTLEGKRLRFRTYELVSCYDEASQSSILRTQKYSCDSRGIKSGDILVASSNFQPSSPFFRSVILILEHSSHGSRGVVVNGPLSSLTSSLRYGGPVDSTTITSVHYIPGGAEDSHSPPPSSWCEMFQTRDGLVYAEKLHVESFLQENQQHQQRTSSDISLEVAGCAAWDSGQLAGECLDGLWSVTPFHAPWVFTDDKNCLWSHVTSRLEAEWDRRQSLPFTRLPRRRPTSNAHFAEERDR